MSYCLMHDNIVPFLSLLKVFLHSIKNNVVSTTQNYVKWSPSPSLIITLFYQSKHKQTIFNNCNDVILKCHASFLAFVSWHEVKNPSLLRYVKNIVRFMHWPCNLVVLFQLVVSAHEEIGLTVWYMRVEY